MKIGPLDKILCDDPEDLLSGELLCVGMDSHGVSKAIGYEDLPHKNVEHHGQAKFYRLRVSDSLYAATETEILQEREEQHKILLRIAKTRSKNARQKLLATFFRKAFNSGQARLSVRRMDFIRPEWINDGLVRCRFDILLAFESTARLLKKADDAGSPDGLRRLEQLRGSRDSASELGKAGIILVPVTSGHPELHVYNSRERGGRFDLQLLHVHVRNLMDGLEERWPACWS